MLQVPLLEFGAYLSAAALGVNLVMTPLAGGTFVDALTSLLVFYPAVPAALLFGAWLEVRVLRAWIPGGLQFPGDPNVEAMRAKALDMIKGQSGGAA
jgi:hypothetical protein